MTKRTMSPETVQRVLQLARDGVPYHTIAETIGTSRSLVQRVAAQSGISRINRAKPGDIVADYKAGFSFRQIIARRKTSFSAVSSILRAYGIEVRSPGGQPTTLSLESLVGLRDDAGWTFNKIATLYKISPKTAFSRYSRWKKRQSSPGTSKPTASAPATSPPSPSA